LTESLETWNASAPGWERERDFIWAGSRAVGERMVAALDPQPGETVLELAAGLGDTGFIAAQRLGPAGRLISSDFAPAMVEAARRRGGELGIENAEHRVLDAQALDLPDGSVDGVLCRWGYMLMPDPAQALAETRRVLRDGGRLAFAVWADARRNPWVSTFGRVYVELGHMERPVPGEPGQFALADPGLLRGLVEEAGFRDVQLEEVPLEFRFGSLERWWAVVLGLGQRLATATAALSPAERERAEAAVEAAAAPFAPAYAPPGLSLVVSARA
jgi:SAM-dependent methyltransferase